MKNRPELISEKGNLWRIEIVDAEKSKDCSSLSVEILTKSHWIHVKVKFGNQNEFVRCALYSLFHFENVVRQPFDFVFRNIQNAEVQNVHQLVGELFEVIGGGSQHSKLLEIRQRFNRRFLQFVVVDEEFFHEVAGLQDDLRHDVQAGAGNIHATRLGDLRRSLENRNHDHHKISTNS